MLSYLFCDRTVTIYRLENGKVRRQVVPKCHYAWQSKREQTADGWRNDTKFLLIMPGQTQRVFVGDRVYDGVGPQVTPENWPFFVPSSVIGLGQVSYVRPAWWDGTITHVEAGNK